MTDAESAGRSEAMGMGSRIVGIVTSPGRTLADIVARPSWIVPMLIMVLLAAGSTLFLYDSVIVPMQMERVEKNPNMTEEQLQRVEEQVASPVARAIGVAAPVIITPLVVLIQAAIILFVGSMLMGGQAPFRTIFAVCSWTGIVYALASLLQTPLYAYVTHRMEPMASLAFLLPSEAPAAGVRFLRGILSSIDVFQIWQFAVLSIGISLAYARPRSFGVTCAAVLWLVGAIIAGLSAVLAGRPS